MAKILNIHPLELKSGVDTAEFERFVSEELSQIALDNGNSFRVMKGINGNNKDQYILVFDQDREYYRKTNFTSEEEQAAYWKQDAEDNPDNYKIWAEFLTYVFDPLEDGRYTHYDELD